MSFYHEGKILRATTNHKQSLYNLIKTSRDYFLVEATIDDKASRGRIRVGTVFMPKELIGKKVKLRVEVIEENEI